MQGSLIREARRRHGVSQRSLAIRAGTSQAWIARVESGAASPSLATVERLLLCLGERLELAPAPLPGVDLDARHREAWRELTVAQRLERALGWMELGASLQGRA